MDTTLMNSEKSKTTDRHKLLLNLTDEINFKKVMNMLLYQTQLQMSMIKKYLKKDVYLQKKDKKLLMNQD